VKKCPYCAEDIKDKATVCRHCGRDIDAELIIITNKPSYQAPNPGASGNNFWSEDRAAVSEPAIAEPGRRKPKWGQIGLAVLLAGAVPIALGGLVLTLFGVVGIDSIESLSLVPYVLVLAVYLLAIFLFHLLPLPFGFWAGLAWPGTHLKGNALLGLSAGLVEVSTIWVLSNVLESFVGQLGRIELLFALGTVAWFVAGGLLADLCETLICYRRVEDLRRLANWWRKKDIVPNNFVPTSYNFVPHKIDASESEKTVDNVESSETSKPSQTTVPLKAALVTGLCTVSAAVITSSAAWMTLMLDR
jgi:hypothetical protein